MKFNNCAHHAEYRLELTYASVATYEHYLRTEIRPCLTDTRVDVLTTVQAWVESPDDNQPRIFWLKGLAGAGKTTIARSMAEWGKGKGILGANIFFSRDVPNLRDPTLVLPTLAYQLANHNAEFRSKLADILSHNPDVATRDFATQFRATYSSAVGGMPRIRVEDGSCRA